MRGVRTRELGAVLEVTLDRPLANADCRVELVEMDGYESPFVARTYHFDYMRRIKGDNKFWDWFNQIKMNTIKRVPVTISLLDEGGKPTMVWTLMNAWPTKITGTDLKAQGNEVAIETIEVAHEGLTIANG